VPKPLAIWNSARDVWERPQTEGLFCEHLDVFSETFPTSGMTLNGVAYGLELKPTRDMAAPMLDLVTHASGSLSLLPTVTTQDAANTGGPSRFERNTPPLNTRVLMLPTPKASNGEKGGPNQRGSSGDYMLPSAVIHLLPTPVAQHSGNTPENHLRKKPGRTVVTDLQILVENDLLPTGGRIVTLLPTPTVGMMMGGSQGRSGTRSNELLLPGVAKQIGESMNQPSAAGSSLLDDQLPGQLSALDAMTDSD